MGKYITEINIHIIAGLIAFIVFVSQAYIFWKYEIFNISKPFAENQKIYDYVYDSLQQVWFEMFIWPVLLFIVLVFEIQRMKKYDTREDKVEHRDEN